jgi:hypothetical protein
MDFSLGDVLWAAGIVVVVVVIGIATAVYSACGGTLSMGRGASTIGLFFRALTWRLLPALTSWYEQNKDHAVNRYEGYDKSYSDGVMSYGDGSERLRPGSSTGSDDPVPPQQNQAAPESVLNFDTIIDYLSRHKLDTPERVVDMLAVLQFGEGHVLSANKIRDIAGGNEAAVKARVASRRPKAEAPKPAQRLERPAEGWREAV